jgi:hypothetical protein
MVDRNVSHWPVQNANFQSSRPGEQHEPYQRNEILINTVVKLPSPSNFFLTPRPCQNFLQLIKCRQ